MSSWKWTKEQEQVIDAEVTKRLLIDAGPGTGKTQVLCARVARLIESEAIQPNEILVLSFTNAAVHELRERMESFLSDVGNLSGIRISTIDSFGALIRIGFEYGEISFKSFTEGIELFSEMIRKDVRVSEYLQSYRHIFIDEAQDIVSPRLESILDLVSTIPESTGVTIFSDEAQGIYGFAEEAEYSVNPGANLPMAIRRYLGESFETGKLTKIHRTQDPNLKKLFTQGRELLLSTDDLTEDQYKEVRELILDIRHEELTSIAETIKSNSEEEMEGSFWLFRRRGEALQAASQLANYKDKDESGSFTSIPLTHRLRISEFPKLIDPQIAVCLWDHSDEEMSGSRFTELANERLNVDEQFIEEYWKQMWMVAGVSKNRISVRRLANALSRNSPPPFFTYPDYGFDGPVVSTIHSSKGRETENVYLYLPRVGKQDLMDPEEILAEARVLFVGATRAKNELRVSDVATRPSSALKGSGRAFTNTSSKKGIKASVEIGRNGDIRADGLVGIEYFDTYENARNAQDLIESMWTSPTLLQADQITYAPKGSALYYAYATKLLDLESQTPEGNIAFYLSKQFGTDLFNIPKVLASRNSDSGDKGGNYRPGGYLRFHSLGARTLAIADDDEIRDQLHSPWRESGFMVAPIVVGYSNCFFNKYGSRSW